MSTPDHCPTCNALLAADQRYCLNCGTRIAQPRVDYRSALGFQPAMATTAGTTGGRDQRLVLVTVLSGLAAILLALGVGIVIGRGNGATSKGQVVTVNAAAAPAPTGSAAASGAGSTPQPVASISDEWASSESGYTVEVGSLDKSSAQAAAVASAKTAATSKGATAVGVLDGDAHSGTPTGKYVIYSGHYTTKAQADAAAARLKTSFPGVIVLHVAPKGIGSTSSGSGSSSSSASAATNSGAASSLKGKSGSAYEQASKKLPKTVGTGGGAPPPKDNKKAGGGTSATCIGC